MDSGVDIVVLGVDISVSVSNALVLSVDRRWHSRILAVDMAVLKRQ